MKSRQTFAVIRTRANAWQPGLDLEQPAGWRAHASFMNGLHRDGLVALGGPFEGISDVVRASSPAKSQPASIPIP